MAESKRTKIKKSLIEQLEQKSANVEFYIDLVDDYMSLYDVKIALIKDVKKRGIVYEAIASNGLKVQKNNPSTKELTVINKQMLSILKDLELSPKTVIKENKKDVTEDEGL